MNNDCDVVAINKKKKQKKNNDLAINSILSLFLAFAHLKIHIT